MRGYCRKDSKIMNLMKISKKVIIGLFVGAICGVCLLGVIRWRIQSSLDRWCAIAQTAHQHNGDDVAALVDYVESDLHTLSERNCAVWALGQARDVRALSVLEKYYSGEKCDHDRKLCQSELKKAIKLCKPGSYNLLCIKTGSK